MQTYEDRIMKAAIADLKLQILKMQTNNNYKHQ